MAYLLYEILLYLIFTALLGGFAGWLMYRCHCNRDKDLLHKKIVMLQSELDKTSVKIRPLEFTVTQLRSDLALSQGEAHLMASRWRSLYEQIKLFPAYDRWISNLQTKNFALRQECAQFEKTIADLQHKYAKTSTAYTSTTHADLNSAKSELTEAHHKIEQLQRAHAAELAATEQRYVHEKNIMEENYQK